MSPFEDFESRLRAIDDRLIDLLVNRAHLVREVLSFAEPTPYASVSHWERAGEQHAFERLRESPDSDLIVRVMQSVWTAQRHMLLPSHVRVACLGPPGTFSHIMALRLFGADADFELPLSINDVLDLVASGHCNYGVMAIMNSAHGAVSENLQALHDACRSGVSVCGERQLLIEQTLMGTGTLDDVRVIYSHYQAIGQCRRNIERLRREFAEKGVGHSIEVVKVASTAEAAQIVSNDASGRSAAIVHRLAGEGRGLRTLRDPFEDEAGNFTRFVIIGSRSERPPPTGTDRTSVFFKLSGVGVPGQLVKVLSRLEQFNLTTILSWPQRAVRYGLVAPAAFDYVFFVEWEGHLEDGGATEAIESIALCCEPGYPLVAGSYPRTVAASGASYRGISQPRPN